MIRTVANVFNGGAAAHLIVDVATIITPRTTTLTRGRNLRYTPPMPAPEPRANPILLGHADAEATILDAIRGGRIHHAWLITGPEGIGKATLAYRFARRLLAELEADAVNSGATSARLETNATLVEAIAMYSAAA